AVGGEESPDTAAAAGELCRAAAGALVNAPRGHYLFHSPWPCLSDGCIEGDRGTDERLECGRVDFFPLIDVDRAPCIAFEARVEEPGRVLQRSPLGEGQLHFRLVRLAGANDPVV